MTPPSVAATVNAPLVNPSSGPTPLDLVSLRSLLPFLLSQLVRPLPLLASTEILNVASKNFILNVLNPILPSDPAKLLFRTPLRIVGSLGGSGSPAIATCVDPAAAARLLFSLPTALVNVLRALVDAVALVLPAGRPGGRKRPWP
jgi:hypothetical protein